MQAIFTKINAQVLYLRLTGLATTHAETSWNQVSKTELLQLPPLPQIQHAGLQSPISKNLPVDLDDAQTI